MRSAREEDAPYDPPTEVLAAITDAVLAGAETVAGGSGGLPEIAIALCATVLDKLLETLIKMDPEHASQIHGRVLRGLTHPGPNKPQVQ